MPSKLDDFEKLKYAAETFDSYNQTLIFFGLRAAGGNVQSLKKFLKKYNIDDSRLKNNSKLVRVASRGITLNKIYSLENILVENSTCCRGTVKNKLYASGIKERKCEMCGQGELWFGKKISLILDHINGVHNDNRITNLRILCPNCNATLPTHFGWNVKRHSTSES